MKKTRDTLTYHRLPKQVACPKCLMPLDQDPKWLPPSGIDPTLRLFRHLEKNDPCPYELYVRTRPVKAMWSDPAHLMQGPPRGGQD